MQLFKSMEKIWWNKGNEVKPTKSDFNRIQWQEVPNFNINWIDEMTISLVCGLQDMFTLIKIVNDQAEEPYDKVRYYYLIGVSNKTKVNKVCTFELDLWTTFILENRNSLFSVIAQKFPTYSASIGVGVTNPYDITHNGDKIWTPLVKFTAASIPKYYYKAMPLKSGIIGGTNAFDDFKPEPDMFIPLYGRNIGNNNELSFSFRVNKNISYISSCIYYVFKLSSGRYFMAPFIQNDAAYVPFNRGKMQYPLDGTIIEPAVLETAGLNYVVNNYSKFKMIGDTSSILGEFVGVFYGPHYNRVNKDVVFMCEGTGPGYYKSGTVTVRGRGSDTQQVNAYKTNAHAIFGYVMTTSGWHIKGLREYNYDSRDYLQAMKKSFSMMGSDQLNVLVLGGRLYFTNMFVFVAEGQTIELNTELPYYTDSYTVKMNNQMNAYNTGYFWNQFNTAKNGVLNMIQSGLGLYTPGHTSTNTSTIEGFKERTFAPYKTESIRLGAGSRKYIWTKPETVKENMSRTRTNISSIPGHLNPANFVNAGLSIADSWIQMANNYSMRKAQLDDMRATMSTVNTTTNSRCLHMVVALGNTYYKTAEDWYAFDYTVGYDAEVIEEWYKLYGYEVNFYKVNDDIRNVPDNTFVKTPDILKLKYLANNILPPTIREALWEMLVNGVLVVTKELATSGGY